MARSADRLVIDWLRFRQSIASKLDQPCSTGESARRNNGCSAIGQQFRPNSGPSLGRICFPGGGCRGALRLGSHTPNTCVDRDSDPCAAHQSVFVRITIRAAPYRRSSNGSKPSGTSKASSLPNSAQQIALSATHPFVTRLSNAAPTKPLP